MVSVDEVIAVSDNSVSEPMLNLSRTANVIFGWFVSLSVSKIAGKPCNFQDNSGMAQETLWSSLGMFNHLDTGYFFLIFT